MNAAEQATKLWLESLGFFVQGPLRVGAQNIHLVGIRLDVARNTVVQKVHVHVSVSGRLGEPDGNTEGLAEYVAKKFIGNSKKGKIRIKVRELLGDKYERWLVIGKLFSQQCTWVEDGPKLGVRVLPFAQVLAEYTNKLRDAPADEVGRLLDTLKCLGVLEVPISRNASRRTSP
jgi:hypothetical protein